MTNIDEIKARAAQLNHPHPTYFSYNAEWAATTILELCGEVERLSSALNTAKNDYWFMSSLLERTTNDKYLRDAVNDCIERMKFRKPMFKSEVENV